jgi:hypothetical protein
MLENLIESLNAVPDGVSAHLDTPFSITAIDDPSGVEGAIIANGQAMAAFHNAFLAPFAGLTILELLLRIGQHNTYLQGMVLVGLEHLGAGAPVDVETDLETAFRDALHSLPTEIVEKLTTPIPECADIATPDDIETAIVASATANTRLTQVLAGFNGIFPVQLFLRAGNMNSALGSALYSSLEYTGAKQIIPIQPLDGGVYYGALTEFIVQVPGGADSVLIELDNDDAFDLEHEEGTMKWSALWAVAIGVYACTITATIGETITTEEISFEVTPWVTFPEDGEEYLPEEVDRIDITDDRAESVTVDTYGGTYTMEQDENGTWTAVDFDPSGNPGAGLVDAIFNLTIDGETIEHIIHFMLTEEEP